MLQMQQQTLKEQSWEFLKYIEDSMGKSLPSQDIPLNGQIFRQLHGGS